MTTTTGIERATARDIDVVSDVLAEAFAHGDFAPWLVPDPDQRSRIYPAYFRILAGHFLDHGVVEVFGDFDGVALWDHVAEAYDPRIDDYFRRLQQACGDATGRFVALDMAMDAAHPVGVPHDYLSLLAVRRQRQHSGIGSALLTYHHTNLDDTGTAAYLEATGPNNQRLYARHGYATAGPPVPVSDGPCLQPMWRTSRTP